jgi:hypothetical protein
MISPWDLSTQQLQDLLAQRQLQDEQALMESGASVTSANTVAAKERKLWDQLCTCQQRLRSTSWGNGGYWITIISRSLLHEIGRHLETLGLVWAVKHFRPYILGHRTTVYTDHAACTSLLNSPHPSGKLARWALTIQEMDLVIKHKAGKKNFNADALSRKTSTFAIITTADSWICWTHNLC